MAIPTTTRFFEYTRDPSEELDFAITTADIIDPVETITSYSVVLPAESLLLGLRLAGGEKAPTLAAGLITIWLYIEASEQNKIAFNSIVSLPIEVTLITSATRKKQRTVGIRVSNK